MSRSDLIAMARHNLAHTKAGTIDQAPEIHSIPAKDYFDAERWQKEMDGVFRRMPLLLAMTCELREPGDYKAMDAAGVPVLISRGRDGVARAFLNSCSHRGAQIMPEGKGNTHRFTCPYHAWTYSTEGELKGVLAKEQFGALDFSCHGLPELPLYERSGLIWVVLNTEEKVDFDAFMAGYDGVLAEFGFEDWTFFQARRLEGPNWKVAYDGYLDLYHLPILHKETFGSNMPHQALYYSWGPHQRVTSPAPDLLDIEQQPETEWPQDMLLQGVFTIFPHVSIASFDGGGGRGVMLSQLFPGDTPLSSYTIQNYVLEKAPTAEQEVAADQQFKFLEKVVKEEDYATGLKLQRALASGLRKDLMFGRNEAGGQRFHGWVDRLIAADDTSLPKLFENVERTVAEL